MRKSGALMGFSVSLTKEFKNRLQRKFKDNFIAIKKKMVQGRQAGCQSQQLPGGGWRRDDF